MEIGELERQRLVAEYEKRPGDYKVMPRNIYATGLEFQAGVYKDLRGAHQLIAECYTIEMAERIADLLNAEATKDREARRCL